MNSSILQSLTNLAGVPDITYSVACPIKPAFPR